MADVKKQLTIKTNSVKRIHKEVGSYEKEATQQQNKINKMKAENADAADVRKQEEVLAETVAMVPDAKKRLQNAVNDLESFISTHESSGLDVSEAKTVIESVSSAL